MSPVIRVIAYNTFRESVRDRILFNILLFALGFAFVSGIISQWSIGQEKKILADFGLTILTIFGLLVAVFIGINLVYKELEKHTIYTILAKPVSRGEFLWGKYFGLLLTLVVSFFLMIFGFLFIIWLFTGDVNVMLLLAGGMIFLQMAVMLAITIFFSTYASPVVSVVLSLFLFIAGHFSADITFLDPVVKSALVRWLLKTLYYIVPNFSLLDINNLVVHGLPIEPERILLGFIYSVAYCAVLLIMATFIFNRRNLK